MTSMAWLRQRRWCKLVALVLILTTVGACQVRLAQVGIPLAYGLTGTCLALLISPTLTAALVGFVVGCVLGAAVYNNSLKLK
jgi:hypothetical protein